MILQRGIAQVVECQGSHMDVANDVVGYLTYFQMPHSLVGRNQKNQIGIDGPCEGLGYICIFLLALENMRSMSKKDTTPPTDNLAMS